MLNSPELGLTFPKPTLKPSWMHSVVSVAVPLHSPQTSSTAPPLQIPSQSKTASPKQVPEQS